MKTIHSTPGGFRIHSPFVYNLVTKGLYSKNAGTDHLPPFPVGLTRQEKHAGRQMAGLIRFLNPEEVVAPGEQQRLTEWIVQQHRQLATLQDVKQLPLPFRCRRLVILSGNAGTLLPVHQEEVWVVTSLKKKVNRECWKSLLSLPGVRVSLETRNMGLLFFHPVLQEERYVIKSWFYI